MPRPPRPARALSIVLVILCLAPGALFAQVRQCIAADGTLVYTDRQCADIEATDHVAPAGAGAGVGVRLHRGCARSIQDLAFALSSAIHANDVNQLASVYDWVGMATANAYRLMARLDVIAKRPLMDVQPVYSGGTDPYAAVVEFDAETGQVISPPPRKPRLVGLRLEQTLANGSTPSRTVFGLRRHLGCWWVRL